MEGMSNSTRGKTTSASTSGSFAPHSRSDSEVELTAQRPHAHRTPSDIDTELAEASSVLQRLTNEMRVKSARLDQALVELGDPDTSSYAREYRLPPLVDAYRASIAELRQAQTGPREAIRELQHEFDSRGGWTRAFLVRNSNGHIHNSMQCPTCFETTSFAWLTEVSGKPEEDIVEMAGDMACTVCYPSAPVVDPGRPRPSQLEDPQVKAAREERAAKKAQRDAVAREKGVWMPDGTQLTEAPMRDSQGWRGERVRGTMGNVIKTERSAVTRAVDVLTQNPQLQVAPAGANRSDTLVAYQERDVETVRRIVTGLAHKRGVSEETVLEELRQKAEVTRRRRGY